MRYHLLSKTVLNICYFRFIKLCDIYNLYKILTLVNNRCKIMNVNIRALSKILAIWLFLLSAGMIFTTFMVLVLNPDISIGLIIGSLSIIVIPTVMSIILCYKINRAE